MGKDYYKILGVEKNATQTEIKKAFHKIAHQYHPDKKGGDEQKFKEANEAYQVLSNEEKRAQYDRFGTAGAAGGGAHAGGFGGFDFSGFQTGDMNFNFDFSDIFGGFGGFNGGSYSSQKKRGRDIQVAVEIEFKDAFLGKTQTIEYMREKPCPDCQGTGAEKDSEMITCPQCEGSGKIQTQVMGIFATVTECPRCEGTGKIPKNLCKTCKGKGTIKEKERVEFVIPKGIKTGDSLRIAHKGEAIKNGEAGDLYVLIQVKPDKQFKRNGMDLLTTQTLSLSEAVLGAEKEITLLDNSKVTIKVPTGTQHGTVLKVSKKGFAEKGDLLVSFEIAIPKKLSKKAKEALSALAEEGY